MIFPKGPFVSALFVGLTCCTLSCTRSEQTVAPSYKVQVLHQSGSCGTQSPGVRLIQSADILTKAMSESAARWSPSNTSSVDTPAWRESSVYAQISPGQQNQGGYAFSIDTENVSVSDQTLILNAKLVPPDPEKMHIQKLDHPCLIAEIHNALKSVKQVTVKLNQGDTTVDLSAKR